MISAITLRVTSMTESVRFYRDMLGLKLVYGGEESSFSTFSIERNYLNLQLSGSTVTEWGRVVLHCTDVDRMHARLKSLGYAFPQPKDAPWGERFFHIKDPDGHELSIAQPIKGL